MPSVPHLLATAFHHHQAGRLTEAEHLYDQVLSLDPQNVDAWHLLGVVAYQAGRYDAATKCLQRAILLKPDYAEAHYHLGNVHYQQDRIDDAICCYNRAIELKPGYLEAHNNLGNAHKQQLRLRDAEKCYRRVLELRPEHANAHFNLGNTLKDLGALTESESHFRRAILLRPDITEAWLNLGSMLQAQRRMDEALQCFQAAIVQDPKMVEAHYLLGVARLENGNASEAADNFEQAIQLDPHYAHAWNDLGQALEEQAKIKDALSCYEQALAERPNEFKFHNNRAVALMELLRLDEAVASFRRALDLNPDSAEVHWNRSLLTLLRGDFDSGWKEYDWRWQTNQLSPRILSQPQWEGEPLSSRTILLHAEQGFGDTFQFIRYAPLIKRLAARVILECQAPLVKVLKSCPGIDHLIGYGDPLPDFDVHCPLLTIPKLLQTDLNAIPSNVPYLSADPELAARWRERLSEFPGFKIGINWGGREGKGRFTRRNIPLEFFASLAEIPNVRLISLQKGAAVEELAAVKNRPLIITFGDELDAANGPFMDTAAIMANLDLVITSDTSIPHLAGALGVRVWLALPYTPDWRWLLDRSESPWYPTMRLFRQTHKGDWTSVFDEIRHALTNHYRIVTKSL